MGDAKALIVKPIGAAEARDVVRRIHYSGKVVNNSTLHMGVYYNGSLEGAMQFGSPMDRRKVLPLVRGTLWNQMLELNRMAFSEALPRNSESRAMGVRSGCCGSIGQTSSGSCRSATRRSAATARSTGRPGSC